MKDVLYLLGQIGLFLLAAVLFCVLCPFGLIAGIFKGFLNRKIGKGFRYLGGLFRSGAIGIDQLGNAFIGPLFNYTLVKGNYYSYGDPDETISGVTGKNKVRGTLSKKGQVLDAILEYLDPNHSIKSIEEDENYDVIQ